jgi:hypothetical protein
MLLVPVTINSHRVYRNGIFLIVRKGGCTPYVEMEIKKRMNREF